MTTTTEELREFLRDNVSINAEVEYGMYGSKPSWLKVQLLMQDPGAPHKREVLSQTLVNLAELRGDE